MPGDGLPPGRGPSSIAQRSCAPTGGQGHPLPRPLSRGRERGASIRGRVATAGLCCRRSACRAIAQRSCAPTANVAWMQRSGIRGDGATGFPVLRGAAYGLTTYSGHGDAAGAAMAGLAAGPLHTGQLVLARDSATTPTCWSRAWPAPTRDVCAGVAMPGGKHSAKPDYAIILP